MVASWRVRAPPARLSGQCAIVNTLAQSTASTPTRRLPRPPLMPSGANGRMAAAIPFAFDAYLEPVDATGRVIRENKKGYIPGETPRILERMHIDPEQFIATTARMLQQFSSTIGTPEHLTAHCVTRNIAFLRGMSAARALFKPSAA